MASVEEVRAAVIGGITTTMLVDVVCLRRDGEKLDAEAIGAATPVRGHLHYWRGTARLTYERTSPPTVGDMLPPLEDCTLHRIDHRGIVLHGVERAPVDRFRFGPPQPQAWWIQLVVV